MGGKPPEPPGDEVSPPSPEAAEQDTAAPEESPEADAVPEDEVCPISPLTILEAMLFVGNPSNEPLSAARAAELMRGVEAEEIPPLVDQLNRRYEENSCPYEIVSQGVGYRLALRPTFGSLRNRFYGRVREAQLSQAAVDVLAIVAYRQPLTSEQVAKLRDRPSGALLTQLVRRQLLRIERRKGKPRKVFYHTTDRFLQLFGLESIEDLPQAEDLEKR
jgi:segregation and condensation protein B